MTKSWLQSKVIWFNALVAILTVIEANLGLLSAVLPGDTYQYLVVLLVVGNAVLRAVTSTGISLKRE